MPKASAGSTTEQTRSLTADIIRGIAVQPDGLDPCDVRLHQGDAAVRELVASRIPLYRFVLRNVVARYDLDHADQRVDALRSAVELVSAVRDQGKVEQFVREIASTVGVELDEVRRELGEARRRPALRPATRTSSTRGAGRSDEAGSTDGVSPPSGPAAEEPVAPVPSLGEQRFTDERELLKVLVQHPHLLAPYADALDDDVFTHPYATAIWSAAVQSSSGRRRRRRVCRRSPTTGGPPGFVTASGTRRASARSLICRSTRCRCRASLMPGSSSPSPPGSRSSPSCAGSPR